MVSSLRFRATLSRVIVVPEVVISRIQTKIKDGRLIDSTSLKFMLEEFDLLLAETRKLPDR